jgi:hypothetical protein
MHSPERGSPNPASPRQRQARETEAQHSFWCRYWEVLRAHGVPAGREIWYERACARFIRELKPRRLKDAGPEDVTQYLALLAQQPDSAGWKIRQADSLRILYQEVMRSARAVKWPPPTSCCGPTTESAGRQNSSLEGDEAHSRLLRMSQPNEFA